MCTTMQYITVFAHSQLSEHSWFPGTIEYFQYILDRVQAVSSETHWYRSFVGWE